MRCGRLAFDAAHERYTDTRLSLNVAPGGQEDDDWILVGQVMKASKGQANPQVVNEVLVRKLDG